MRASREREDVVKDDMEVTKLSNRKFTRFVLVWGFFSIEKEEDWLKTTSPKSQYLQCSFNTTTKHSQEMSERQDDMLDWLKENSLSAMSVFTESSAYG